MIEKIRRQDLVRVFHETYQVEKRNRRRSTVFDIAKLIAKGPAPRFYVDFNRTRVILSQIRKGHKINIKSRRKIDMYHELYEIYLIYEKKERDKGLSSEYISLTATEAAINSRASSFFLDALSIRNLIYKAFNSRSK